MTHSATRQSANGQSEKGTRRGLAQSLRPYAEKESLAAFFLAILIVGEHQPISAWVGVVCVLLGLMVIVRSETQRGSS